MTKPWLRLPTPWTRDGLSPRPYSGDAARLGGADAAAQPELPEPLRFAGRRVVFVASTGGHLTQLHRIAQAMDASDDSPWITFDSKQSTSLLRGSPVTFVPYIRPRGYGAAALAFGRIYRTIRDAKAEAVVSTGSAVAGPAFVAARLLGVPCYYIESVSRIEGPSLTGRTVAALHLAEVRTQNWGWANSRWQPYPSVLSTFEAVPAEPDRADADRLGLFVTLGTIRPYRFDAVVDAVLATGLCNEETVWQLGVTTRRDLPGRVESTMTVDDFRSCSTRADVVVTHAGVGNILTLLDCGVYPVVVPRRQARGEHVDDHQTQIAAMLASTGLAAVYDATDVDAAALMCAAGRRVRPHSAQCAA